MSLSEEPGDARISKDFGARVRALREATGVSQERFAEVCAMHRTYYGAIERGAHNVSLINIHKIAAALGMSIATLFEGLPTIDVRPPDIRDRFRSSPPEQKGRKKRSPG